MEAIIALLCLVIILAGCVFGVLYAYRNRRRIGKWLNDPTLNQIYTIDRAKLLKRKMEDCQEELDMITKRRR
jgi:hypothetical protein